MKADKGFIQFALVVAGTICALADRNYAAGTLALFFMASWLL